MTDFVKLNSNSWHDEIPGTRWFKADLHIHTLDDHPSTNFTLPEGMTGDPRDKETQDKYAREFLRAAITAGIEVIGLTPHSAHVGDNDQTSVVWRIIEIWNEDNDEDDIPFRDKIYAIFPGFEPNLSDSDDGLHLIFLFDPEIGKSEYLSVFSSVMKGMPAWNGNVLNLSPNKAEEVFDSLEELRKRLMNGWDYIILAPHAFSNKGLFSLKSEILKWFPHQHISGLQLKESWIPEDAYEDKSWLQEGMEKHHHTLFQASDAYKIENIGYRYSILKLANHSIEALRQAFLAPDSRVRIPYIKNASGTIEEDPNLPESNPTSRPWLKSVSITGGTSFFSTQDGTPQTFLLNPDLNCIIGGRMSGKSTFLDGIRYWFGHPLPVDDDISKDVEDRAKKRFLSGDPDIDVQIHSPLNPELDYNKRWPATFFAQRELQKAVMDQEIRKNILYRLIPNETDMLLEREEGIIKLDEELKELVDEIIDVRSNLEESEEEFRYTENSKAALKRFEEAGIDKLIEIQSQDSKIEIAKGSLSDIQTAMESIVIEESDIEIEGELSEEIQNSIDGKEDTPTYKELISQLGTMVAKLNSHITIMEERLESATKQSQSLISNVRSIVQKTVIESGGNAEELNDFVTLTEDAADYELKKSQMERNRSNYLSLLRKIAQARKERGILVSQQRGVMQQIVKNVQNRFPDSIRINIEIDAMSESLEQWIFGLREGGVTKWWNTQKLQGTVINPDSLRLHTNNKKLDKLGMSPAVEQTFSSLLNPMTKLQLSSIRNDDKYHIQLKVGQDIDDYKDINELSGGAQVSVLLSLILETDVTTPLVIDQPEDEMDKSFMFEIFLPALRRLKGRRQVILATHEANIVVNGDADNVIFLKAEYDHGWISQQGAIEDEKVKQVIISTLDGGQDAFELRKAKYGF